ncbi:MAG: hypothetical protein WCS77_04455 [Elusimicrobiaceae bacterium]|jgi:hypothetical protein
MKKLLSIAIIALFSLPPLAAGTPAKSRMTPAQYQTYLQDRTYYRECVESWNKGVALKTDAFPSGTVTVSSRVYFLQTISGEQVARETTPLTITFGRATISVGNDTIAIPTATVRYTTPDAGEISTGEMAGELEPYGFISFNHAKFSIRLKFDRESGKIVGCVYSATTKSSSLEYQYFLLPVK